MNLTNDLHFCRIQTLIPIDILDEKLQLLRDAYGRERALNQRFTCFQHANLTIRIDEPADAADDAHTVVTLGELKRAAQEGVTVQHALRARVCGSAHRFVREIGPPPARTWIERGYVFDYSGIAIKVFEVLRHDEQPIDALHFVVSIEGFAHISQHETNDVCQQILANYNALFGSFRPFVPTQFIRS